MKEFTFFRNKIWFKTLFFIILQLSKRMYLQFSYNFTKLQVGEISLCTSVVQSTNSKVVILKVVLSGFKVNSQIAVYLVTSTTTIRSYCQVFFSFILKQIHIIFYSAGSGSLRQVKIIYYKHVLYTHCSHCLFCHWISLTITS